MDYSKLLDFLKLSPKYFLVFSLMTGFLLFTPRYSLDYLELTQFVKQYKPYISIVFIASLSLLVSELLSIVWLKLNQYLIISRNLKNLKGRLHDLTLEEKQILARYIQKEPVLKNLALKMVQSGNLKRTI